MTAPAAFEGFMGCEWPIDEGCLPSEWPALDDAIQLRSIALAVNTLRRLTGYRVGGCPITVRPCKASCAQGFIPYYGDWFGGSFAPHMTAQSTWVNSCGCTQDCACTQLCEVNLPGPVGALYEVKVDGAVVASADYFVDGTKLVWAGAGDCPWPTCQDLSKPDTETGTFSVKYLNSYPADGLAAYAAGTLAWEYAQACIGNNCRLPANVTAVTRQGVSYEIQSGAFPDGFTGIHEVDAFISLWNPGGLRQQVRVWSPDMRQPRFRTLG